MATQKGIDILSNVTNLLVVTVQNNTCQGEELS